MAEEQKNAGAPSQPKKQAVKKTAPATTTTQAVKKGEELSKTGKMKKWFKEMKAELKKVIWPTTNQTVKNTGIALGMMLISSVAIWGFDQIAQMGVKALLTLVG